MFLEVPLEKEDPSMSVVPTIGRQSRAPPPSNLPSVPGCVFNFPFCQMRAGNYLTSPSGMNVLVLAVGIVSGSTICSTVGVIALIFGFGVSVIF